MLSYELERLQEYKKYLNSIQKLLDKYFDEQKDYIFCKKGCACCCEKGVYPYSELEFEYLKLGFLRLEYDEKMKILNRISQLKTQYEVSDNKKHFIHRCPFLNDNQECSVYEYRGIICRNFGIMHINSNNEITMPFCVDLGLNYSDVYDKNKNKIDFALAKKYSPANIPRPYPVTRDLLMDKDIFEKEPLDFGETKALIEWL